MTGLPPVASDSTQADSSAIATAGSAPVRASSARSSPDTASASGTYCSLIGRSSR